MIDRSFQRAQAATRGSQSEASQEPEPGPHPPCIPLLVRFSGSWESFGMWTTSG